MSNVQLGYTQVIDPISFKSIPSGKIYIGEYGTLPNPANAGTWKQAYFVNSDGTRTAASQPIATNAAGYAVDGAGNIKSVQVDGKYSILVQSALGSTKFSAAKVAPLVSSDQVDAGGGRTQADKNTEIISVRDHITTAVNGVTSNQDGIVAAVAAAYAAGARLYWPLGTYVSTANIPNLHKISHFGDGVIKRGAETFAVNPTGQSTKVNNIYISASGSATNDGLSSAEPMAKFQNAFDALNNYDLGAGVWTIVAAAGTYTLNAGAETFSKPSRNRVIVKGPSVGGHPNVPTCLVDGGGNGAAYNHGLNFDGPNVRVQVQDVKFQNFTEASGNTRVGLLGANGADVYTVNIHTFDCSWTGIMAKECDQARLSGGILDGNNTGAYGFISDSTRSSFGYGSTSTANGPVVKRAVSSGVYWSTGSQGHCDFVNFEDNSVGFLCAENSRCDTVGNNYKRNTVAKRAITGGMMGTGGAVEVFNDGTADANTTNIEYKAYSGNIDELDNQGSGSWMRAAFDRSLRTASGAGAYSFPTIYTLEANRLQGVGKSLRFMCHGSYTVTAASTVVVNIGGFSISFTVPAAATNAAFQVEFELMDVAGGHRAIGKLIAGLNGVRMASATGFTVSTSNAINVSGNLVGAGDSINIYRSDVYLVG